MNRFLFHRSESLWNQTPMLDGHILSHRGNAYLDNQSITTSELAANLSSATSIGSLKTMLQHMNGFYCWIEEKLDSIRAAVDHIRSIPLFYAIKNGNFYLSDEAEWVRQKVGDNTMDPMARDEFLLAGYVTGRDTLYPNVKQLQAGEWLEAKIVNGVIELSTHRYYKFWHAEPPIYDEFSLRNRLENVTLAAIKRMIKHANGRKIIVPLSGGYDSRLVASMLKRLEYTNVLCFTYGLPGNKEAAFSKKVAKALGFEWVFVEYSSGVWRKAWASSEADVYRKKAANHVSLPHVQDWLAIQILLEKKLISSGDLVVPGHSGDFVAGSHIPLFVFDKYNHMENDLLNAIQQNHLSNCPFANKIFKQSDLHDRIRHRMAHVFDGTAISFANLYELWDWQERQAKYIVNSVRVYDQFSLDWWLPLWDAEFVKFWQDVPLVLRKERKWYKEWIVEQYEQQAVTQPNDAVVGNASDSGKVRSFLFRIIKNVFPKKIIEFLKICRSIVYKKHFLAFEGLVSQGKPIDYFKKGYNIIGVYSYLYINDKWK